MPGGDQAMRLTLTQQYLAKIQGLARNDTNVILPYDLGNLEDLIDGLKIEDTKKN